MTEPNKPANPTPEAQARYAKLRAAFDRALDEGSAPDNIALDAASKASLEQLLDAHHKLAGGTQQQHLQTMESASTLMNPAKPGLAVGPFQLLRELGRGGMGVVWLAERVDQTVQQQVAIKLLPPHRWDQLSLTRFGQERKLVASLDHPGIARLLDAGELHGDGWIEGQPYFAMEYVAGKPITQFVIDSQLTIRERVTLFLQVLAALDYAHRNLVVHRDLKPANILVTAAGITKLIDFGIAKFLSDANETATAQRFFSPNYAAPEQLLGKQQGVSIDVYQIGAVLYELLAGKAPFDFSQATPAEIEQSILHRVPKTPNPEQADLSAIALKALRKAANERYASIAELAEDLRRYLSHRPISARTGQFWYRTQKFLRRNAVAVSVGAVFTTTVIGFIWHAYSQQIEITKQRDIAVEEKQNAEAVTGFLVESFNSVDPNEKMGGKTPLETYLMNSIRRIDSQENLSEKQKLILLVSLFEANVAIENSAAANALSVRIGSYRRIADPQLRIKLGIIQGTITAIEAPVADARAFVEGLKLDFADVSDLDDLTAIRLIEWGVATKESNANIVIPEFLKPKNWPEALSKKSEIALLSAYSDAIRYRGFSDRKLAFSEFELLIKLIDERQLGDAAVAGTVYRNASYAADDIKHPIAAPWIAKALEIHEKALGIQSMSYRRTLNGMATIEENLGNLDRARSLFLKALQLEKTYGSETSEVTASFQFNLGNVLAKQRDFRGAIATYRKAYALALVNWGAENRNSKNMAAAICQLEGAQSDLCKLHTSQ